MSSVVLFGSSKIGLHKMIMQILLLFLRNWKFLCVSVCERERENCMLKFVLKLRFFSPIFHMEF